VSVRLWITGAGAVAAAGRDPDAIWDAIAAGRSAIAPVRHWDTSAWPVAAAGEVADFDPSALVADRKAHKLLRRGDFFGLYAAERAIAAAGLDSYRRTLEGKEAERFDDQSAVYVGSGVSAYQNQYDFLGLLGAAGDDLGAFGRAAMAEVHPMWLLRSLPNNVLCHVGIRHGFKGPNLCLTSHSVSGALALAESAAVLRAGEADRALAVAHEAPIEPETTLHFHRAGLLSAAGVVRPFDRAHDGALFGEGGAALVVETEKSADGRGAAPIGELLGTGSAAEGEGLLALRADGDGLARAIELALADAGIAPRDVGLIVAHGNGTPASDASEAAAIRRIFEASMPPVTAFKWALGHTLAASALLDAALALVSLRRGIVPGVATLEAPAEECHGLSISRREQRPRSDVALVLSRGFGGTNAAIVLRASRARGAQSESRSS